MTAPSLVCVGEVLVDLVPDVAGTYEPRLGGAPANVAVMSAAFGTATALISRVGDDWLGRFVAQQLTRTGVDVSMVTPLEATSGIAVVAPQGAGPPDFLMYRNGTADSMISFTPPELDVLAGARVVHVSSLLPTSADGRRCVEQVLELRGRTGGLVSHDVNLRRSAWPGPAEMRRWALALIEGADIIKVTEGELRWLDITLGRGDESRLWLVTDGPLGARLVGPHGQVAAEAPLVPVVDTTGAGDAALAAVLSMMIARGLDSSALTLDDAQALVRHAVDIGSRVVQHAGATAWLDELRA